MKLVGLCRARMALALFLGVLPTLLFLCVSEGDKHAELEQLIDYCTDQAKNASSPSVFLSIAKSIGCLLEDENKFNFRDASWDEFRKENRAGATTNLILASFVKETHLGYAIAFHAFVMHEYSHQIQVNSTLWLFLTDQLMLYWDRIIENQKFSFSSPSYVEEELNRVKKLSQKIRVQNLILTIMDGLKVSLPENLDFVKKWLFEARERN